MAPTARVEWVLRAAVVAIVARALWILLGPVFADLSKYGFHDWDAHAAYRYITVLAVSKFHEGPWWNPYLCGGFPSWAYVEGSTTLLTPYMLLYLLAPIQVALRFEVLGDTLLALGFAYLLAGRFTGRVTLRALVAVVFALNGRWALQFATGHTWHLQYAWVPLALYFFDRAVEEKRLSWALHAGWVMAVMIYRGGLYPLPHAGLLLCLFAAGMVVLKRSAQPLLALVTTAGSGIGLAAPKLLPVLDLMQRFPRGVESTEALGTGQLLAMVLDPEQAYHQAAIAVPNWGWHEYGLYLGLLPVVAIVAGLLRVRRGKEVLTALLGLLFLALGMGCFHALAPWTLLHKLPVFSSQHVPSRFMFVAVLLLMLVFAQAADGWVDALRARWRYAELPLLLPLYLVAADMTEVGRKSTEHSFSLSAPPLVVSPDFHHLPAAPAYFGEPPGYTPYSSTLLAMQSNHGVLYCYGAFGYLGGAVAVNDPRFHGEAWVANGTGTARVVGWSPNWAEVEYVGVSPGSALVYNMNYEVSWKVDGEPAVMAGGAVGKQNVSGSGRAKFSYYPRTLNWGLLVAGLTTLIIFNGRLRRWWAARRPPAPAPSPKSEAPAPAPLPDASPGTAQGTEPGASP